MTGAEWRAFRKSINLTQNEIADHVGYGRTAVQLWDKHGPPRLAELWAEAETLARSRGELLRELAREVGHKPS